MKTSLFIVISLAALAIAVSAAPTAPAHPTKPAAKPVAKPGPQKKPITPPVDMGHMLDVLTVPAFATVPTEFSFAGTQNDLLGMVQSLAHGAKVANVKPLSSDMNGAVQLFSDADLLNMLDQIHVLSARSLSFRGRGDEAYDTALKVPTSANAAEKIGGDDPQYALEQKLLGDAQKFYAGAFTKQGGREQLTLQNGQTSIAIYGFSSPRSFALLTRGPSRVIVVRADGLPKLNAVGRLFRQVVGEQ